MIPFRILSALTLLFVGVLLVTGCTFSSPINRTLTDNATIVPTTPPLTITAMPPVSTPTPVQCPRVSNGSVSPEIGTPFIAIKAVPHHYFGDTIQFTGTTNLAAGENITIFIYDPSNHCPKCQMLDISRDSVLGCCHDFSRTILADQGECGINTWLFVVNTSQHGFYPDGEYIIEARGRNGLVGDDSIFTVSGIPQPNLTLNLPKNDPSSDALLLSGEVNTGNGQNERLLLTVSSDSGKIVRFTIPVFHDGNGDSWNFSLKKPEILPYNFYTVNITSVNNPQIGIIRTFFYNNEPQYYPYNPYSP